MINTIFDVDKEVMEKIEDFKSERILKHSQNEDKYKLIFHSIPLDAFSKFPMPLNDFKIELGEHPFFQRSYFYNFEGLYNEYDDEFVQVFSTGILEVIFSDFGEKNRIYLKHYVNQCDAFVKESLKIYAALGINCPIVFYVTVINIRGYILDAGMGVRSHVQDTQRDILNPMGIIIKDDDNLENNINNLFVPIWNHFGISKDYKNTQRR